MKHTSEPPMTKEPRRAAARAHGREVGGEAADDAAGGGDGVEAPPIGSVPMLTGTPGAHCRISWSVHGVVVSGSGVMICRKQGLPNSAGGRGSPPPSDHDARDCAFSHSTERLGRVTP